MKKRIHALFMLAVLLVAVLVVPAYAAKNYAQLDYITDAAGILDSDDLEELNSLAGQVSEDHDCGVYVILVEDYRDYASSSNLYDAAKEIYTSSEYDLGYSSSRDGILLLLSMEERDYAFMAHGNIANDAFTDYGKYLMEDNFKSYFRNDDWKGGIEAFINDADSYLEAYENGNPVDVEEEPERGKADPIGISGTNVVFSILVPALIAFLLCNIWKSQMKSVAMKGVAGVYLDESSVRMRNPIDRFTHQSQSRRRIQTQNNNDRGGGGGGGTTVDKDGFSGHTGKF